MDLRSQVREEALGVYLCRRESAVKVPDKL